MKWIYIISIIASTFIILTSCANHNNKQKIQNVGMLTEGVIHDQAWEEKGYNGLRTIGEKYDVKVYIKESIQTEQEIIHAVDMLVKDGVNLIFGHSNLYGKTFNEIAKHYPDVHFVYFNGAYSEKNVTSLNFKGHAMGFFGGMVAGKMSQTNQIGIIAAYEWQPEIEGFFEGAKYQNVLADVHIRYINDWNIEELALESYNTLKDKGIDVVYPAGDSFSTTIVEKATEDGLYAIGYGSDQSHLDEINVLTSTIQDVELVYAMTADQYNASSLEGGVLTFDFQEGIIALGEFSPRIPNEFEQLINELVETYIETDVLPHEH